MTTQAELDAILRNDFYLFMQRTFKEINPGAVYIDNWHMQAICYQLWRCWTGEITRLIITLPPRYGKSICTSIALPAWILGHDPTQRIIATSYVSDLAVDFSNSTRKVMKAPWYKSAFPSTLIDPSKDSEELFRTTQGGFRLATSVGGAITGKGGNLIIIDDPIKATTASTEKELQAVIDYYSGTLYSRLDNKQKDCIILVMQRTHEQDLAGYLLEQGGWTHLNLPAIAQVEQKIALGPEKFYIRKPGEILHPARESFSDLEKTKNELGIRAFGAQYQQTPVPIGGGIIEWENFKAYEKLPNDGKGGFTVQSWDTAMEVHEGNSYSVCTTWFCYQSNYYLKNVWRHRMKPSDLTVIINNEAIKHEADLVIIEHHNGSQAIIETLLQHSYLNILYDRPNISKVQRMVNELGVIDSGRVFLPEHADWLPAFQSEITKFPEAKHDDQVDSLSQFLLWARKVGPDHPTGRGTRGKGLPGGPPGLITKKVGKVQHSQVYILGGGPPTFSFNDW